MAKNKKLRGTLILMFGLVFAVSLVVAFYISNNLHTVLERAAVMSLKPIKPGWDKKLINEGIAYAEGLETDLIACQTLRINCPIALILHGGYFQGGLNSNYAHLAGIMHRAGFVSVVPQIPSTGGLITSLFTAEETLQKRRHPTQVKSVAKLISWLAENAAKFNADPSRILIIGLDSGTHIAFQLALEEEYLNAEHRERIRGVIAVNPLGNLLIDDEQFMQRFIYPGFGQDEAYLTKHSFTGEMLRVPYKILLINPEFEPEFATKAAAVFRERLTKANNRFDFLKVEQRTVKSLVFRLGRRYDKATEAILKIAESI